jgi:hypothetical protein
MKFKQFVKKYENAIKIISILFVVFALWLAFSPVTPAREGIANWFGGINSIWIMGMVIGIGLVLVGAALGGALGAATGGVGIAAGGALAAPFVKPGLIIFFVSAFMFWGVGLLQNIFATTNPIVLIILGAVVVWWIMRPRRPIQAY